MVTEIRDEKGNLDFKAMAEQYMKEHKCRWSVAALEIKHRYPASRAVFGAPPAPAQRTT
jgi:hypothetical protein